MLHFVFKERCLIYQTCCHLQLGKTKVFLRAGQMAELDARRAEVLGNAARRIQRQSRTYIARKEFRALRGAAIVLQSNCRGIFSPMQKFALLLCYCCFSCPAYWIHKFSCFCVAMKLVACYGPLFCITMQK